MVGATVVFALQFGQGVDPRLANAAGIGVGVVASFVLSRIFVFRKTGGTPLAAVKFAI